MSGYSTSYDQYLGKNRCCTLKVQGPPGPIGPPGPAGIGPVRLTGPTGPAGNVLSFRPTNAGFVSELKPKGVIIALRSSDAQYISDNAVLYVFANANQTASGYVIVTQPPIYITDKIELHVEFI